MANLSDYQQVLTPNYGLPPTIIVKGQGCELFGQTGERYLDLAGGIAVSALGHCHPDVVEALTQQANKVWHLSNVLANEPAIELAKALVACTFADRVFFCNSGAEANEAALKLVRKYQGRGRHGVVSALRSFHGRTLMSLAATGQPEKHEPFQPLPEGFRHVVWNDLAEFERSLTPEVGGVILESVQGEGGVNPADDDYLRGVRQICDERGLLLIFDEVQAGMGRTGAWFGFQHAGVRPDVVTMAKGIANGMPVGAMWARDDVAAAFVPGDHGSTYAGQPLALSAARATLAELERIDAPAVARAHEATFRSLLEPMAAVDHVRGRGLLLGVELTPEALAGRKAGDIARVCLDRGLVVNGVTPTALRLAPPFIVTDEQIAEGVEIIGAAIAEGAA